MQYKMANIRKTESTAIVWHPREYTNKQLNFGEQVEEGKETKQDEQRFWRNYSFFYGI